MDISISRWFLLSLWWRELFFLAAGFGLVSVGVWMLLKARARPDLVKHELCSVKRFEP